MAYHKSAEKRARQALKRKVRNNAVRSQVNTADRAVRDAAKADPKKAQSLLGAAFRTLQKSKGVLHRNAIKRKMARLSKAAAAASSK